MWRSRPGGEGGDEHLRGGRPVAQGGMRADGVGVLSPAFDDDLRFPQGVEDLAIQEFARSRALNDSTHPFSQGDPGAM